MPRPIDEHYDMGKHHPFCKHTFETRRGRYGWTCRCDFLREYDDWNTRIPKAGLPTEDIIDAINDWLSCGESRLTPDEVREIAETIHTRLEGGA